MLRTRGYVIDNRWEENIMMQADNWFNLSQLSILNISGTNRNAMNREPFRFIMRDNKNKPLVVYFPIENKLGVGTFRAFVDDLKIKQEVDGVEERITKAIIVVKDGVSPQSTKIKEECDESIEIWTQAELSYCPLDHISEPKYRMLDKEERMEVLKRYHPDTIKALSKFPKESAKNSIIARYFDAKEGDVIEIIRTSFAAGESKVYRVFV
jgi:DNA-directed RNA polymerase I, II, and III subunit RPABC1